MKTEYLSGKSYKVKERLQVLSQKYPESTFGTGANVQFHMRLMKQGLARQFARERRAIP